MGIATRVFALALVWHGASEAAHLSPPDATDDKAAAAASYGLQPGMNVLLVGWYPVRDFVDWSDPPMDCVSDTVAVVGCQFGNGKGQVDLAATFKAARLPLRMGDTKHMYSAWRADGWLWVERAGVHGFRVASADDGGRLTIAGVSVQIRPGGAARVASMELARGFHPLRVDGFNTTWGLGQVTEWKPPGAAGFSPIPSADIFRGVAIQDGPRLYQVACAGVRYACSLPVSGGVPPYKFVARGLPPGLGVTAKGTVEGTPGLPGFYRFTLSVTDARGAAVSETLGLRVLPPQTAVSRNDGEVFQLSFDDTDPATLQGGLISGRSPLIAPSLQTVGRFALYAFHPPAQGQVPTVSVVSGGGAFGSSRFMEIGGAREMGFYIAGLQEQVLADHAPALRRANRYGVAIHMPRQATVKIGDTPVAFDWSVDPRAYALHVLSHFHMAGHNVTRYVGHRKEQANWHFYHPPSQYWGDHWQPSYLHYLGDGWWYYETADEPSGHRSGTADIAGVYEPLQDTEARYFDTLSRWYTVVERGWGATANSYAAPRFGIDQLRVWREEPGVDVRYNPARKVARLAIPPNQSSVEVPFQVTHTCTKPCSYWVSRFAAFAKVPAWDGRGIYLDANANGAVDAGEAELGLETPVFQPGETKRFVCRVETGKLPLNGTAARGVNLRAHDPADPWSLRGDSMMILIHKSENPRAVPLDSLTALNCLKTEPVRANQPPVATIEGPAQITARAGRALTLKGTVSDPDGPERPQAAWDFGDDTEITYGPAVTHTYARPGRYTVTLRAADSILERMASVKVTVTP